MMLLTVTKYGITRAKLVHIQIALKTSGTASVDKRGNHGSKHSTLNPVGSRDGPAGGAQHSGASCQEGAADNHVLKN